MKPKMSESNDNSYESFAKNPLIAGLKQEQIRALFSISHEITLNKGEYLLREGDPANEMFIIMEGSLEVSKYDMKYKQEYVINTLHAGDSVGELALLDTGPRSASIRAKTFTCLRKLPFADIHEIANKDNAILSIIFELSKNISKRLRCTTDVARDALEKQVDEYKTRVAMGNFIVNVIIALCLIAFGLDGLKYAMSIAPTSSYVTIPLTFSLLIFTYFLMKSSNLPWSSFGLTFTNLKRSVYEGIGFTCIIMVLIIGLKLTLIHFIPAYEGRSLIEPYALFKNPADHTIEVWLTFLVIYGLLVSPLQELMARGALQGLLEQFLAGEHKILLSIIASNLIFSTAHLFMSFQIGILVFVGGLYLGWLYSRTHNLVGVWVAHWLLGSWALSVVGL
ncbi:MAG: cyclic nucleotide-binding domain-containing protein [Deltaproteobacteria bacterium]|nr:cyclic nucleotide-binding domain-containing protein [Deltaproteobacteria bacterium]